MKKTFLILAAVAMVFGMAMNASAATSVSVTLTSPTITKAAGACEKAGAVTFTFPAGAVLNDGDWWYMDLPENATLCKPIDYLIVGDANGVSATAANRYVYADSTLPTYVKFNNNADALVTMAAAQIGNFTGPLDNKALVGAGGDIVVSGNLAIRVVGNVGSRRVTMYVASDNVGAAVGTGSITVPADSNLTIKVLDGAAHAGITGSVAGSSKIITDINKAGYLNTAGSTAPGIYRVYGQQTGDAFPTVPVTVAEYINLGQVPFVENTLCVSAQNAVGNLFVSFASLNDEFTFTGDSQIAHTGTGNAITLSSCLPSKDTKNDLIKIGGQNACTFEYDAHAGYCDTYNAAVYLMSDTVFGELNDLYDIKLTSKTTGVYFKNTAEVYGLAAGTPPCDNVGTIVATTSVMTAGTAFAATNGCSIAAANQVSMIATTGGAIASVHNYKYLYLNLPDFVYDSTVVGDGTEVVLNVELDKYPCGQIFSGDITIGTFVITCTSAPTGATTLLYPYLIGTDYAGWFSGFVVTNGSTTAGTAVLTAVDEDGNTATYTTPSIGGLGVFNASFLTDADWTQDAGNAAPFTMAKNFVVRVQCAFNNGSGMAFIGNTVEGYAIGYTAATNGALD